LPILPDLLCCRALAVADYSYAPCALHLRQTRQPLNRIYQNIFNTQFLLRVRGKITSQNWRSDLVQVWPIRESKTTGIASYFEDFASEVSVKDGLKVRCKNVKGRDFLKTCVILWVKKTLILSIDPQRR